MKRIGNVIVLIVLTAAIVALASSVVIVDETEHVVVTQFGKPTAVYSEAGLRFKAPAPIQRVTRFDKRKLFTETRPTELLTADKKNVVVGGFLSWQIVDPLTYLRAVRTREFAEARLTALVQSELGSSLGDVEFSSLVSIAPDREGLMPLENSVRDACRVVAGEDYGIEFLDFGITRLNFPPQNLQSVFARMRAERARIAKGYRSEGEAEALIVRAEADRERAEIIAKAKSEADRVRGEGEAEAAGIYAAAYSGHEEFYSFIRTLKSYEKVLGDNTTLVLPSDSPFLELLTSRMPQGRAE
jgi:membrane protease subunit HflC